MAPLLVVYLAYVTLLWYSFSRGLMNIQQWSLSPSIGTCASCKMYRPLSYWHERLFFLLSPNYASSWLQSKSNREFTVLDWFYCVWLIKTKGLAQWIRLLKGAQCAPLSGSTGQLKCHWMDGTNLFICIDVAYSGWYIIAGW